MGHPREENIPVVVRTKHKLKAQCICYMLWLTLCFHVHGTQESRVAEQRWGEIRGSSL